jgi:hypothetical protein
MGLTTLFLAGIPAEFSEPPQDRNNYGRSQVLTMLLRSEQLPLSMSGE